jgi:hypothetical protein
MLIKEDFSRTHGVGKYFKCVLECFAPAEVTNGYVGNKIVFKDSKGGRGNCSLQQSPGSTHYM